MLPMRYELFASDMPNRHKEHDTLLFGPPSAA